jgi:tetratricopeptide (TPR) repeat protein
VVLELSVYAVRASPCCGPLGGVISLFSLLGLFVLIEGATLSAHQRPAQYPERSDDELRVVVEKLDKANSSGDLKQAEAACRRTIEERPNSAVGYICLGQLFKREQDLQRALSAFQSATRVEAGSFDGQYDLGEAYLVCGQPARAIDSLSEAVRLRPDSIPAHRLLAQAFMEAGKTREGVEHFLRSVELDSANPEAFYDLGQACLRHALGIAGRIMAQRTSPYAHRIFAEDYLGHGSLGEAETQYQLALKEEPAALDLHLSLGELYLRENKIQEARSEIAQAVKLAPNSIVAYFDLAKADFLGRNLQSALASLEKVANSNAGFLRSNPTFLEPESARAVWKEECSLFSRLLSHSQPSLAVSFLSEECRHALEGEQVFPSLVPKGSEGEEETRARIRRAPTSTNGDSVEPCSAGLCTECGVRLEAALRTAGKAVEARIKLGHCAYDVSNFSAALRQFAAAAELAPQSFAALYWEQEAARQLARTSFEQVARLAPDSYMIDILNAQTWEKLHQLRRAEQEYKAAIARRSDAADLHVFLGHLYWNWGRYDDALSELNEALRLNPNDPAANYLVGDIWVREHEAQKALPYLDEALRLRPGFVDAEASRGRALGQLGRNQEAVAELLKVETADADGSIHFQLFQLYEKLGEKEKAEEALASFKRIRAQQFLNSASGDASALPQ